MTPEQNGRSGDLAAAVRVVKTAAPVESRADYQRAMIAQWCRLLGKQFGQTMSAKLPVQLSPRLKETLELLLSGYSEKEVARKMGISTHTVHVHVKNLHKKLGVTSRGELLSFCLQDDSEVRGRAGKMRGTQGDGKVSKESKTKKPRRRSEQ